MYADLYVYRFTDMRDINVFPIHVTCSLSLCAEDISYIDINKTMKGWVFGFMEQQAFSCLTTDTAACAEITKQKK